ncbi:ricin B-like lectin R40G3 [Carex rostrata]
MEDDRQLVTIHCCQNEDYSLSIRGGKIVFVLTERRDRYQVLLILYNPDSADEVLWTMPKDMEQGFTNIRRMDDISLLFTPFLHQVYEPRRVHLCHFVNNNNSQRWNIVRCADSLTMDLGHCRPSQPTVKIYCQTNVTYNLKVSNDAVLLAPANPADKHWIKETTHCQHVKDEEKRATFALVNKATGKAIKHSFFHHLVRLAPFDRNSLDVSVLWTESGDMGKGFREIRMLSNTSMVLDSYYHDAYDNTLPVVLAKNDHTNQRWKIEEIK